MDRATDHSAVRCEGRSEMDSVSSCQHPGHRELALPRLVTRICPSSATGRPARKPCSGAMWMRRVVDKLDAIGARWDGARKTRRMLASKAA